VTSFKAPLCVFFVTKIHVGVGRQHRFVPWLVPSARGIDCIMLSDTHVHPRGIGDKNNTFSKNNQGGVGTMWNEGEGNQE
jgi:hypothetical protein